MARDMLKALDAAEPGDDSLGELKRAAAAMFSDQFWGPKASTKTLRSHINEFRNRAREKAGHDDYSDGF